MSIIKNDILEIIKKVRNLLSDPKKWTQRLNARDKDGHEVGPNDPQAVCWCVLGAFVHIQGPENSFSRDGIDLRTSALMVLSNNIPRKHAHCLRAFEYNDLCGTHAEMLQWLDNTITNLEARIST